MSARPKTGYDHTEVLLGPQKVLKVMADFVSRARVQIDACMDSSGPSMVIENAQLMDLVAETRARGGKIKISDRNYSDIYYIL